MTDSRVSERRANESRVRQPLVVRPVLLTDIALWVKSSGNGTTGRLGGDQVADPACTYSDAR